VAIFPQKLIQANGWFALSLREKASPTEGSLAIARFIASFVVFRDF